METATNPALNVTNRDRFDYSGSEELLFIHLIFVYVCLFFSIVGSTLLIRLMMSANYRDGSFSIHIRCLAVSDVFNLVMSCLWHTDVYLDLTKYLRERLLMRTISVCWAAYTLLDLPQLTSAWYIVTLSIDRYIAVVYPLKRATLCTRKNAVIICLVVFILSVVFEITASIPRSIALIETNDCESDKAFVTNVWRMFANTVACLLIPIPCIMLLNVKMLSEIRKSFNAQITLSLATTSKDTERSGTLRAALSLGIVCIVSVLTLTPVAVRNVSTMIFTNFTNPFLFHSLNMVRHPNYALNFYVLMIVGSKFRKDMAAILCGPKTQ